MLWERLVAGTVVGLAVAGLAWSLWPEAPPAVAAPAAIAIEALAIPLDAAVPARTRVGTLEYRGGVVLRSADPLFGGLSGLRWQVGGQGGWLLAVSDTGNWLRFRAVERGGRLVGVSDARIAAIAMADGRPAARKADGDAEALEWDARGVVVAFEQEHRLQYWPPFRPGAAAAAGRAGAPARVDHHSQTIAWPSNGGGEAMARLPDGRILLFSERARRRDGSHEVLLIDAGAAASLGYRAPAGFSPTDAAALDSRHLLVLNRRFDGRAAAELTLVDLAGLRAGTVLTGHRLARLEPPLPVDNMEGLALRREGREWVVYLLSDDNFSAAQRTLLLKFAIRPEVLRRIEREH